MSVSVWLFGLMACRTSMNPGVDPGATARQDWDGLLSFVVTDDGLVDYDQLEAERGILDRYVASLAEPENWKGRVTKDWHPRYLNAYNALVLYQVLERGRPDSVRTPRRLLPVPGAAFFLETQFKLGPDWLSLSEIEHERVRMKELDIRDHAALNCASRSCPPLRQELYRGKGDLKGQLDDQMSRWVMDDERGVRVEGDTVVFSAIFDWYGRDFDFWTVGKDLCTIAAEYASGLKAKQLRDAAARGCPHRFADYDWSLNDASAR